MKFIKNKLFLGFFCTLTVFSGTFAETVSYVSGKVTGTSGAELPQQIQVSAEGKRIELTNDRTLLTTGDHLYLQKITDEEGVTYSLFEIGKLNILTVLFILFILVVLTVNGIRGFRPLISLVGTTLLTLFGLLPLIAQGYSPIITTVIFSIIILSIALFVTHGFNRDSLLAFISSVGAVLFAGVFASLSLHALNLSSVPTDELAYLSSFGFSFEIISAMLFAGIIVGTLGVVDDVAITQIAIVRELKRTDEALEQSSLFAKAMRVGREHVGALVNTLAFAYIGASLPLFVLLSMAPEGILIALQKEPVIVEIVRILSGSIGVLLVVPIATALAVFYTRHTDKDSHTHAHNHPHN